MGICRVVRLSQEVTMARKAKAEPPVPSYRKRPSVAEIKRREAVSKVIDEHRTSAPPLTIPAEELVRMGRMTPDASNG